MPIARFVACITLTCLALVWPASAQERQPSHCIAVADAAPGVEYVQLASLAPVPDFTARLSYLDHAMFLIQSPGGTTAVTDYVGYLGQTDFAPDIATMNHAHSSHWTARPDPRIEHVLRGWSPTREPADHYVEVGDMLVRNVPTDIRSSFSGVEEDGNSIFIFETAGLCIGHLGHLHHEPDDMQYAAIGRLDVVMAPVDGGLTLPVDVMTRILKRLRSSVVIPMHWWGRGTLDRFLAGMADEFEVEMADGNSVEVSLRTLPDRPTVIVLSPAFLSDG